jgi:hypothetical protein
MSHSCRMPKLIFIQLNEVNFDVVRLYADRYPLPNLSRILSDFRSLETFAEREYAELEPWIQWVSVYTGKPYADHKVFRLGDIVHTTCPQLFEVMEARGLRVGALSPMNARNGLSHPAYFVPDPWTQTGNDGSGFSRRLTEMLRQTVNDNAHQRISMRSVATLAEAVLRSFDGAGTLDFLRLIAASRGKPWMKALVLDKLLHLIHKMYIRRTMPDVSFVFFNAGAHIQHHYFFNSEFAGAALRNPSWYVAQSADPVLDMLRVYDAMLGDYIAMFDEGSRLIVATGLTQMPYGQVKFYYRLKDHGEFLSQLGISFANVLPRMTRDFEIIFDDEAAAQSAIATLTSLRLRKDGVPLFKEIEVRGCSLFVTLTYPHEVLAGDEVVDPSGTTVVKQFGEHVSFVAIKNGMHSGKGYAYFSPNVPSHIPHQSVHVASLFDLTLDAVA